MNTNEINNGKQEPEAHNRQPGRTDGRTILGTLKLLPSSKHEDISSTPERRLIHGAGVTSAAVIVASLTEEETRERHQGILQVIVTMEDSTHLRAAPEARSALFEWLARSRYSIEQITAAAESVSVMETYGRPFAREFWSKAFAQPLVHPKRIGELCRQAYEKGRKEGAAREENPPTESGMDEVTKRLLDAEKELMNLREERTQMKAQISQLEREARAAQRKGEAATAESITEPLPRFYRLGGHLIVEHFRRNGQVYYHEQGVEESNIPTTRSRQMPAADFDRQIAEKQPSILTDSQIAELPGYGHWESLTQ